jgi:endonuclease I
MFNFAENNSMKFGSLLFPVLSISLSVTGQIPPGYYDSANGLTGEALKTALHNIIKNHTEYPYSQTDELLMETDEDPDNSDNVILLYKGTSQAKSTFGGNPDDWNREHVWAKSHGDFGDVPPCGTDLHHMKPEDASVNADRGNKDFDNGGVQHPEATGCYWDDDSWEPRDEVKGDVARMIFYMSVRYEGDNGEPDLEVVDWVNSAPEPEHGKFSALYQWHQDDPPDAFEINRNNVIYSYQDNRNPFIDHPEYLILIYDPTNAVNDRYYGSLSVYPNPASEYVCVSLPVQCEEEGILSVTNVIGQLIETRIITHSASSQHLDISSLPNGLHILTFQTGARVFKTKFRIVR